MTTTTGTVSHTIYSDLRKQIENGQLKPGDVVTSLPNLAHKYDCAVNTARAAIVRLRNEGWIRTGMGRPTVVLDRSTASDEGQPTEADERSLDPLERIAAALEDLVEIQRALLKATTSK